MCVTPKFGARIHWSLNSVCPQPDAENVPDAEIRRSNSLKLKFGRPQPEAENVPDAEIRHSNSLKLKFGLLEFAEACIQSLRLGSASDSTMKTLITRNSEDGALE